MVKYKGYGNKAITKYVGTEAERTAFDTSTLTPGDEWWVEDKSTSDDGLLTTAWTWTTGWRRYHVFST